MRGQETEFEPSAAVESYFLVITERDASTTEPGKGEFDCIAQRLRARWKEWQGENSLHEMAFGEPEE
jgi:hypothetical protein